MKENRQKAHPKPGCRFYHPQILASGAEVRLPEETAHHAIRTLRLKVGDPIVLFDDAGGEYLASISRIDHRAVTASVSTFVDVSAESPLDLALAQAISGGERMDFTIQKAVELGVREVQPLETERCVVQLNDERATRRAARWRKIAVSACEQSGRNRLVNVAHPQPLANWLETLSPQPTTGELRMLLSPQVGSTLAELPDSAERIVLLVGPEGGLTMREVDMAERRGFHPVRLGPRILRTETAALAALAAIQCRWGDF